MEYVEWKCHMRNTEEDAQVIRYFRRTNASEFSTSTMNTFHIN